MDGCIKITGVDIRKLVSAVYDASSPQGMGHMHYVPGPLSSREVERIVGAMKVQGEGCCLSMDYVLGRAVKFHVFRDSNGDLWTRRDWFDHSEIQLFRALKAAGWKEENQV